MPQLLIHLQKASTLTFLIGSMLATGLTLTLREMLGPLRNWRLVGFALILNFAVAPALAWLIANLVPMESGYRIGLLLLGGAAGAPFFPKLVETARGDTTLAAALMGLLTLGTIIYLPIALPWMVPGLPFDPWPIARPLVLLILLPLAIGMLVKHWSGRFAARATPVIAALGNVGLISFFILLIAIHARALIAVFGGGAILAALVYCGSLLGIGWWCGGPHPGTRRVVGLATSARNFGAALVPATGSLTDPNVTLMIIISSIACLAVTTFAARGMRRRPLAASPSSD